MKIGLKHLPSKLKGSGFKWKLREIHYELKYAWQRAWRGYDNIDVWAFGDCFLQKTAIILEDYKEHFHCLWWCPEGYDWSKTCEKDKWFNRYLFSEDQMKAILDTLIFHLKMSNEDYVEKHLYGKNIYDDDYDWNNNDANYYMRIETIRKQNQDSAMDLLKLLMDNLWC